jgi:hypothetical protein
MRVAFDGTAQAFSDSNADVVQKLLVEPLEALAAVRGQPVDGGKLSPTWRDL